MGVVVELAPRATYRLQMHAGFGFDQAAAIADYLEALGVSHVYSSPYLQAAPGSTHGYDVVDPRQVNQELGGAESHARFCQTLGQAHLGQVLDVVPNHMSIAHRNNRWWWDVLENGPSSPYALYFDVDWQPPEARMHNIVLLPILGDHYGRIVEAGEIQLVRERGNFTLRYHDHVLPVAPRSLDNVLASAAHRCQSTALAFLADAFGRLPLSTATDKPSIARRHRDKEVLREMLARLADERREIAEAIDQVVAEINVEPDAIDALLERQNYRLAFWRTAGRELGYRRFFDINTLVSLRMEDEQVFADTHALVLAWLKEGVLDGLRIDHPDGLRDPQEYFARLRQSAPAAWIVVEKILEPGEHLPASWPIAGTTGYDFLNRLAGLYVDPRSEAALSQFYEEFTGQDPDYAKVVHEKKLLVLRDMFGSDVNRLTALFLEVCERHRRYRDYTRHELHEVLREVLACFPVYRTYVRPEAGQVSEDDTHHATLAVEAAEAHRPDLDPALFAFLRDILLLRIRGALETELVARFQQLTGPVMAKGVEDTVFYNYNRLISLNEVGGDPGRFGVSLEQFHEESLAAHQKWPQAMIASSTHDTKRSEDVRARISLLSEIPDDWIAAVKRWSAVNQKYWRGRHADPNTEYFLYQTLLGAWPLEIERAQAYMLKAIREAKAHTSWTSGDELYEQRISGFVESIYADAEFRQDFEAFVSRLIQPGRVNSLAQTLLKLTLPNIPDIYQGSELWDLSLVDPDNRRPVDYDLRRRLLKELADLTPQQILERSDEGLPKLWVISQALRLRKERPEPFSATGDYESLMPDGPRRDNVVAFLRGGQIAAAVPRLVMGLEDGLADTELALGEGRWKNLLTGQVVDGRKVAVADLWSQFPVALLARRKPK